MAQGRGMRFGRMRGRMRVNMQLISNTLSDIALEICRCFHHSEVLGHYEKTYIPCAS